MSIPEPQARIWAKWLTSFRRLPKGEGFDAVVVHLAEMSRDEEHAKRIVTRLREGWDDWPGPATMAGVARDTSEAVTRAQKAAESDYEKWKREFDEIRGGLCVLCEGYGIVMTEGRITRCSCPEGRPKWLNTDGKPCSPDWPGAQLYNSDEHLARWNKALAGQQHAGGIKSLAWQRKKAADLTRKDAGIETNRDVQSSKNGAAWPDDPPHPDSLGSGRIAG